MELVNGLAAATLLDPRFKAMYLQPLAHAKILKVVSDKIETNAKQQESKIIPTTKNLSQGTQSVLWDIHEKLVMHIFLQVVTKILMMSSQVTQSTESLEPDKPGGISGELRNFLHQPVVSRNSNPLEIWESIKSEYSHLYPIARNYLSRMVTSVPSERLFSKTGETYQNRYRLNATRMARLTFLSSLEDKYWFDC